MDSERFARLLALFERACALPDADRAAFLDQACGEDLDLRRHVEGMLAHDERPIKLVGEEASGAGARLLAAEMARLTTKEGEEAEPSVPRQIGQYRIVRRIGEGGMGTVFEAEQQTPRRRVALKVIRPGLVSRALLRRFELEAHVLGRLQHTGIAQIYEAGTYSLNGGTHAFLAMEYVHGTPLTEYVRNHDCPTAVRLELAAKVCDAVEHAHQKGVIHRDLKPANILVAEDREQGAGNSERKSPESQGPRRSPRLSHHSPDRQNACPMPKVLDFGVARTLDADLSPTTVQTGVGQIIGTLPYMSPEQIAADPDAIDTRADVYALGVILYEVLAGRLPHDVKERSLPEAARMIRDEAPARLSSFSKVFCGDVETIVSKALEKDKTRRYASAAALGADIRRYLAGEPIEAKRDSAMYVLRKQLRRYRLAIATGCTFVILLAAFAGVSRVQSERNRRLAVQERGARLEADAARERAELETRRADAEAEKLRKNLYLSNIGFAQAAYLADDVERLKQVLERCPEDLRGWEWNYLRALSDESATTIRAPRKGTSEHSFSPDRSLVACSTAEGLSVLETSTGREVQLIRGPARDDGGDVPPMSSLFLPSGHRLAVSWANGGLSLVDLRGGRAEPFETDFDSPFVLLDSSPDGSLILLRAQDALTTGIIIDAKSGRTVRRLPGNDVRHGVFSADGGRMAVGTTSGAVRVFATASGEPLHEFTGHTHIVIQVAFSPNGAHLASASADGTVRIWELSSGRCETLRAHSNKVWSVAWSPDSRRLASAGTDCVIHITNVESGQVLRSLHGHESTVKLLAFTPDGNQLWSSSADGTVRRWDDLHSPPTMTRNAGGQIWHGLITPDGRRLFCGLASGEIEVWDTGDFTKLATFAGHEGTVSHLAVNPNGTLLASSGWDGKVIVHDIASGTILRTIVDPLVAEGRTNRLLNVSFDAQGRWLITQGDDGAARKWDPATGQELGVFKVGEKPATGLAISPDGSLVASGTFEGPIKLWDPVTLQEIRTLNGPQAYTWALCFSPDGTQLACASEDGQVYAWDMRASSAPRQFFGHSGPVHTVSFSPDATRLVSGGWDNTVRLWDFDSGEELLALRGHIGAVYLATFTADGKRIVSRCNYGLLKVWE